MGSGRAKPYSLFAGMASVIAMVPATAAAQPTDPAPAATSSEPAADSSSFDDPVVIAQRREEMRSRILAGAQW